MRVRYRARRCRLLPGVLLRAHYARAIAIDGRHLPSRPAAARRPSRSPDGSPTVSSCRSLTPYPAVDHATRPRCGNRGGPGSERDKDLCCHPAYVGRDLAYQRDQCRWFGGMVGNHVADLPPLAQPLRRDESERDETLAGVGEGERPSEEDRRRASRGYIHPQGGEPKNF